jgi:hypothetical protein
MASDRASPVQGRGRDGRSAGSAHSFLYQLSNSADTHRVPH